MDRMAQKRFNRVGVLMGGVSEEREVSLASGMAVVRGLSSVGYKTVGIDVARDQMDLPCDVEAVFIALHGAFGEDGTVQTILEQKRIPYTGSGPEASRRAFDKRVSKSLFVKNDIPTPSYEILKSHEHLNLPLPVVIKPPLQGSSIGIERVFKREEWRPAFKRAAAYHNEVLVESFVEGRELTVGILGEEALPVLEIRAPQGNYDYTAKYSKGLTQYHVPAPLSEDTYETCQVLALKTFQKLGCWGIGRVDFRMNNQNELFVLELNTIPGLTETSLLPQAAQAAGMDFAELCDQILHLAKIEGNGLRERKG